MRGVLLFLISFWVVGCSHEMPEQIVRISGPTMGTSYNISWIGQPDEAAAIQALVDQRLKDINRAMSTYDPTSELSLLNQGKLPADDKGWIRLSDDLFEVLAMSHTLYRNSGAAFDVTVGPLVNLWGFGPEVGADQVPDAEALNEALSRVGSDAIALNVEQKTVRLAKPVYIDLSAIAKGWAVDEIAALLNGQQRPNFMVEIGGEIRTQGQKPDQQPWRIAIERPNDQSRNVGLVIEPGDRAVATSGDYRNFFESQGKRYSHTINPRTGWPVTHNLASVTVVHESSALADGWATALTVAGPEHGMALAEQHKLAVFMIIRQGDALAVKASAEFLALFPHTLKP